MAGAADGRSTPAVAAGREPEHHLDLLGTLGTGTLNGSGQATFVTSTVGVRAVGEIHRDGDGEQPGFRHADGEGDLQRSLISSYRPSFQTQY